MGQESPPTRKRKKQGTLSGIAWLGGGQVAGQLVTLASRVVLARLLAPEAFGLVAMATVVIAFQDLVSGLGIPAALIQAKQLDDRTKSSAFWATTAQAALVAALGCAAAPWVAEGFDEPELTPIVVVLVAGGALLGPMRLMESLLVREMVFRPVALRKAVGKLAGGVAAVSMALAGYGVWSLVAGRLLTSVASLVLVVAATGWRPALVLDLGSLKKLTHFGAGVTVAGVIHAINKQVPAVIIGKWLGSEPLGYFSLAQQVVLLPLTYVARPVANVLFSAFARMQDRRAELAASFERWQFAVVAGAAVLPALAAAVAGDAVPLLLGAQWSPAVAVFQVLAIPATAQLAVAIVGATLRALGLARELLLWTLLAFVLQAAGVLVGVRWGLLGAVAGWSAASLATLLFGIWRAAGALDLPPMRLMRPLAVIAIPVGAAVLAGALTLHAGHAVGAPGFLSLGASVGLGGAAYFGALRLTAPNEWAWLRRQAAARLRRRQGAG